MAGYIGLNVAAVSAAVMLGLQPLLEKGADGRPLYFPYPLEVAVPAMAAAHVFLFGIIEGIVTGLLVIYFQHTEPPCWSRRSWRNERNEKTLVGAG